MAIRQLQITLLFVAGLAVVGGFAKLAFGFFNFALVQLGTDRPKAEADPIDLVDPVKADAADDSSYASPDLNYATSNNAALGRALDKTRTRAKQLGDAEVGLRSKSEALRQEKVRLGDMVQQRRVELRASEETAQRLQAETTRASQQIEILRAERDELERRIAALRATATDVERKTRQAAVQQRREASTPQVIDCIQGAVILVPQQVRIPVSEIGSGQIAALAKKNGVYLLVRPTGFESFIAARKVAGKAGVVGYEPRQSEAAQ